MKVRLYDLFRFDGTIDRGTYLVVGLLLFAVKHNIDRFVAWRLFHRSWSLFSYLIPTGRPSDTPFYATLLLLALPFICIGTTLTLRRLRSAKLPAGLVILFFVP